MKLVAKIVIGILLSPLLIVIGMLLLYGECLGYVFDLYYGKKRWPYND
jgi:hypothetical protein